MQERDLFAQARPDGSPSPGGEGRGEGGRLSELPPAAIITPPAAVRAQFLKIKPLAELSVAQRGWTLDVLNIVRRICEAGALRGVRTSQRDVPANEFTNDDVYAFERELEALHPGNRHIRDKIRQQLQVLRDTGFLVHAGRASWRLK